MLSNPWLGRIIIGIRRLDDQGREVCAEDDSEFLVTDVTFERSLGAVI